METNLTPEEQAFAIAAEQTQTHFSLMAAVGSIPQQEGVAAGQAVTQILTRYAMTLPAEKRAPFFLACGCPPAMISEPLESVNCAIDARELFGSTDPMEIRRLTVEDPIGMMAKAAELTERSNARTASPSTTH